MLKVLSYNIERGKKLPQVAEWIIQHEYEPDIICLQEMPDNKVEYLSKLLADNGYSCKYAPGYSDHGVRYGELTAYNKDKLKLMFSEVIDLGTSIVSRIISNLAITFAKNDQRYTSLLTVLKYKKQSIIILNIHLLPFHLNRKRRKQLGIAIEAFQLFKFVNLPNIIVGDYNYSSLIGRDGLIKFMAKHGFKIGGKKIVTHRKWRIGHQLDYVFYKNCEIKNLQTESVKFSDHYPFFFDLELT